MLASRATVAAALGLPTEDALSASQEARVDGMLERVSAAVAREANRNFTPGPVQVRVLTIDGRVYLPDMGSVESITDTEGASLDVSDDAPGWWAVTRNGTPLATGTPVVVDCTRQAVPAGVVQLVASATARNLTIEPGSPESQATDITAGADFRVRLANWTSSTAVLTRDEIYDARGYRLAMPSVTIHRM